MSKFRHLPEGNFLQHLYCNCRASRRNHWSGCGGFQRRGGSDWLAGRNGAPGSMILQLPCET